MLRRAKLVRQLRLPQRRSNLLIIQALRPQFSRPLWLRFERIRFPPLVGSSLSGDFEPVSRDKRARARPWF
jgi:hypothetical protein